MKTVYRITYTGACVKSLTSAVVESVEIALEKILAKGILGFNFYDHDKAYEVNRSEMTEGAWNAALALAKASYPYICFFGKDDNDVWYACSIVKYHE